FPENVQVARESEAIRILGAWFGNNLDAEQIWTPMLEKIDTNLERWAKHSPTMEGRRHIVQMIVGGMTQYLTTVQNMLKSIETRLEKRINTFMWKERQYNPVSKKVIYGPLQEGG
ncbi:hypothetical protein F5890DRAFT_1393233, partial [Lentinula detonsa]